MQRKSTPSTTRQCLPLFHLADQNSCQEHHTHLTHRCMITLPWTALIKQRRKNLLPLIFTCSHCRQHVTLVITTLLFSSASVHNVPWNLSPVSSSAPQTWELSCSWSWRWFPRRLPLPVVGCPQSRCRQEPPSECRWECRPETCARPQCCTPPSWHHYNGPRSLSECSQMHGALNHVRIQVIYCSADLISVAMCKVQPICWQGSVYLKLCR